MPKETVATCAHEETWFDRSICPEPCDSMHNRCVACGKVADALGCFWEADVPPRPDLAEPRHLRRGLPIRPRWTHG
jgi:hypothetical protein